MAEINRRSSQGNRRTYLRITLDQPINYVEISAREAALGQILHPRSYRIGILLDISAGGIRLLVESGLKEGACLALELDLPGVFRTPHIIFGRVIHRETHRIASQEAVRVRFEKLSETVQDQIVKFIFDRAAER